MSRFTDGFAVGPLTRIFRLDPELEYKRLRTAPRMASSEADDADPGQAEC